MTLAQEEDSQALPHPEVLVWNMQNSSESYLNLWVKIIVFVMKCVIILSLVFSMGKSDTISKILYLLKYNLTVAQSITGNWF